VLVIQTELEPGNWLHLATLMPNPYFLNSSNPLSADRLALQGLSLAAVLLLSLLVVRWITRPLAALSDAAEAFGTGGDLPALPESGSRELVNTVRAFNAMRLRILRFMEERDRLFVSISHDLRTPITRLKLRAGLMDDETLRDEFEEDLDELDMMVKGALQLVKDGDIHEDAADVRLDPLILRLVRGAGLAGHQVAYQEAGCSVRAKPLALKRAIGNLIDNALSYGKQAEVSVGAGPGWIEIRVRDHGPGVPEDALPSLSEPYVRLPHGRKLNAAGTGLGLNITRRIVESQGGELILANHAGGGLCATIRMPA
jgi:signal transduction histidine kinase